MGKSTISELCSQLGFCPHGQNLGTLSQASPKRIQETVLHCCEICGRSSPVAFLAKVRSFWKSYVLPSGEPAANLLLTSSENLDIIYDIIEAFIASYGDLEKESWPLAGVLPSRHLLRWSTDRTFIKYVLSELFALQIMSAQTRRPKSNAGHPILPPSPTVSTVSQRSVLMTTNEPQPVEFESEAGIEDTLYEWKNRYPSQPLPGFSYWVKTSDPMPSQTTGIYNNDVVKLFKIFVFTDRVLWLLKRTDQKLLLLARSPENGTLSGYVGWIGGIEGFGTQIIVQPETTHSAAESALRLTTPSNRPEDPKVSVLNSSPADDSPRSSFGRLLRQTKKDLYVSEFPKELELSKSELSRKKARMSLGRQRHVVSEEPSGTIKVVGQESWPFKKVKVEAENDERLCSFNESRSSSPLSSISSSDIPLASITNMENPELTERRYKPLTRPRIGKKKSTGPKKTTCDRKDTTHLTDFLDNRTILAETPTNITFKEEEQPEPKDPFIDVVLQFIVPGTEEGAMPVPLTLCKEKQDFFDRAKKAWSMASEPTTSEQIFRGVKCVLEGAKWPLIIVWDDEHVFDTLRSVLQNSKATVGVSLNVEIRCMV